MALKKYKLGDYITRSTTNNRLLQYGSELIEGVNNEGVFQTPKGDTDGVDLKPYKIVNNGAFVYNPSRLDLGSIAYRTNGMCIVSHLYIIFYLTEEGKKYIDPTWLYIYLRRNEFYREVSFRNFGSQRPEFNFNDMSEIRIPLPPISIQQKYVDIYKALVANQQAYERGLEDLKLVCDGYIEDLRKKQMHCFNSSQLKQYRLGELIEQSFEYNNDLQFNNGDVIGVTINKELIATKADVTNADISKFLIVRPNNFVYNPRTHGEKIGLGYNNTNKTLLITCNNTVFKIKHSMLNTVLPEYLMFHFRRSEWDREACYRSWGSSTVVFSWETLCEMEIYLPSLSIQRSIADIYMVYAQRKSINEQLKAQIRDICPILIKGSIEEARKQC